MIEFFLNVLNTVDCGLFSAPNHFEVGILSVQIRDFIVQTPRALPTCLIRIPAKRLAFNFQLYKPTIELVHSFRFGIDLHTNSTGRLVDKINRLIG